MAKDKLKTKYYGIVRSIYDFDKSKSLATSLENIYVPWS